MRERYGLPQELVETLRHRRGAVVPFVGAGLAVGAGVRDLTGAVRAAAAARGLDVVAGDLLDLVRALTAQTSLAVVRRLVADTVLGLEVQATPTLAVLARSPRRVLATFNYDDAIERAVEHAGLVPRTAVPGSTEPFRDPASGEVLVVHLHGSAHRPDSIVLPGLSTEALNADSAFMALLRTLWARYLILYIGFRFGPTESHLRSALGWLAAQLPDAEPQILLAPEPESTSRGEEWRALQANPLIRVVPYAPTPEHDAVHLVALTLAPTNEPTSDVVREQAPELVSYYTRPSMTVVAAPSAPAQEGSEAPPDRASPEHGPERIFVQAPGGMGKTQYLRARGRDAPPEEKALLVHVGHLPSLLDDERDPCVAVARLLTHAGAFDARTPLPTSERLDTGRYLLLFDGIDEVGLRRRDETIGAILAAAARWPQHGFVIAGRETGDRERVVGAGFTVAQIDSSPEWGAEYLRSRGVPAGRVTELYAVAPAIADLLGVPMYAAAVGERLVEDGTLPARPLELLVDGARRAIAREAAKWGRDVEPLYGALRRLALGLQVVGGTTFAERDLAAFLPDDVDTCSWRRRLIEAGVLAERVPGETRFALRTVQEALAADAVLPSSDVTRLVVAIAAAEVDGVVCLRSDIAQWLDLVWENAAPAQRTALRGLDEHRWLRTVPVTHSASEAVEALEAIWRSHLGGELVLQLSEGVTRGIDQSMERIRRRQPAVFETFCSRLATLARDPSPRARASAMQLGGHADAAFVLAGLDDESEIVRGAALWAVARQRNAEALGSLRRLLVRYPERRFAYARAMIQIADDTTLPDVAGFVLETCPSLSVVHGLATKLPLDAALSIASTLLRDAATTSAFLTLLLVRHEDRAWAEEAVFDTIFLATGCGIDPRVCEVLQVEEAALERKLEAIAAIAPQKAEKARATAHSMRRGRWETTWSEYLRYDEDVLLATSSVSVRSFRGAQFWSEDTSWAEARRRAGEQATALVQARLPATPSAALAAIAPLLAAS